MSIFIDNKYTRWYYAIISNAQARITTGYIEKHHIIPRSLGGNDAKSNIVSLTAREHLICHWLLIKMTKDSSYYKMSSAFWRMVNGKNSVPSRVYEIAKKNAALAISKTNTGKKRTEEVKRKMSENRAGIKNVMYGKKHSEETKNKIREKRAQQDNSHLKGREITQEWREKIRESLKGITKGVPKPKKKCEVCGGLFAGHIITRYHNNQMCKKN